MAVENLPTTYDLQGHGRHANAVETTATPLTTGASFANIVGSGIDARVARSVSYTVQNTGGTNTANARLMGANKADLSDAVVVNGPTTISINSAVSFTDSPSRYKYYFIQAQNNSGSTTVTCNGYAPSI